LYVGVIDMVKEWINISDHTNNLLKGIKTAYHLKNKSQAVEYMLNEYYEKVLQPIIQKNNH